MRKVTGRRPADFVCTTLSDERLGEMWSGLERAEERRRARAVRLRRGTVAGVALCAALLAPLLLRNRDVDPSGPDLAHDPSVTPVDGVRQLVLPDGSRLELIGETQADVVAMTQDETRVRLARGTVVCDVRVNHERHFVVEASGFEVVVTGTHFSVSLGVDPAFPSGTVVSVERGSVEVRQPPDRTLASLGPGQRWSSEMSGGPAAAPPQGSAASARAPCTTCEPSPGPPAVGSAAAVAPAGPRSLFERGNAARLAGNTRAAAAAFDELRRRYPADARAGYAAFMLGRMRLDTLDDPNGAVDALAFAVQHTSGGFFLEDAEARLVEALAKAGRSAECQRARDLFLEHHPRAARAALVAKQCSAR